MIDLTAFQRDIIRILYHEGEMIGLDLKQSIEQEYDEIVNHGRLYPNLDTLKDKDYVRKRERDRRSYFYSLTDEGEEEFQVYQDKVLGE